MHLFCRYKSSALLAQLTHRVLLYISVPYPLPHTSVATPGLRISVVLLVPLSLSLGVFLTEPAISQLGTAGMRTRTFRFPWHLTHLPVFGHKESPHSVATVKASFFILFC